MLLLYTLPDDTSEFTHTHHNPIILWAKLSVSSLFFTVLYDDAMFLYHYPSPHLFQELDSIGEEFRYEMDKLFLPRNSF
jgi:hypothetical protein